MPNPWSPGDNVQVRVGEKDDVGVWCNAVVDALMDTNEYCCSITDDPRPTLADCGKTHPYLPDTTRINVQCIASAASNTITGIDDSIRDPI